MGIKDKTILVIEDERPLLVAIQDKLNTHGMEIATARSVEQALSYLEDLPRVDAIWVDHYLIGQKDGIDFVARIKSEKSTYKRIPVFVISNTASADKVQAYIQLGVEKYFAKSDYRLDEIIGEIARAIERGE